MVISHGIAATILVLMIAGASHCQVTPKPPTDPFLKAYVGKDLSSMDDAGLERSHAFFKKHVPKSVSTQRYGYAPASRSRQFYPASQRANNRFSAT